MSITPLSVSGGGTKWHVYLTFPTAMPKARTGNIGVVHSPVGHQKSTAQPVCGCGTFRSWDLGELFKWLSDHASLHDQLQALVRDATNERRSKELTRIYRDAHRRIRDHQVKTVWKVDQAVVGNPKCDQRVMVRIAEGHPRKSVRQAALGNPSAPAHFKAMGALIQ